MLELFGLLLMRFGPRFVFSKFNRFSQLPVDNINLTDSLLQIEFRRRRFQSIACQTNSDSPSMGGRMQTKVIVGITVPVAAVLVLLLAGGVYILLTTSAKKNDAPNNVESAMVDYLISQYLLNHCNITSVHFNLGHTTFQMLTSSGKEDLGVSIRKKRENIQGSCSKWSGAFSFAEWLVQHPQSIEGRRIIELGRYMGRCFPNSYP